MLLHYQLALHDLFGGFSSGLLGSAGTGGCGILSLLYSMVRDHQGEQGFIPFKVLLIYESKGKSGS